MFRYVLFTLLLVFSGGVLAGTLEGLWQKQGEAVWIEFTANSTTGVVVRNDKKPEAVGFEVVRDLEVSQSEDNSWKADVFAAPLGEYKPAEVMLLEENTLRFRVKVGFMRRSVDWLRVSALPDE